jgi:SAM-dependent methyltransferase
MEHQRPPTTSATGAYIPALSHRWLTPLYDPLVSRVMPEIALKRRLVEGARIEPGHRVLDVGCGTGTLATLVKRRQPRAQVVGLDPDDRILGIARAKAARSGLDVTFERGTATRLPYSDASFDRVLTTLVLHHLKTNDKRRACSEMLRVLRPGGELHVADFDRPHTRLMRAISLVTRHFEEVRDNIQGLLPVMFRDAGFDEVRQTSRLATAFGTVALWALAKPGGGEPDGVRSDA